MSRVAVAFYSNGRSCCLCSTQTEYSHIENGRYIYRIHRSPMCEYMINFILKLKQLPEKYMMNSVLENFTVLQVSLSFLTLFGNEISKVQCMFLAFYGCPM